MIRAIAFACALAAAAWSYVSYAPEAGDLERRIAGAQGELRSDEVAFAHAPLFERERVRLQRRYARVFAFDPQSAFVRDLGTCAARHAVKLLAVDATAGGAPAGDRREIGLRLELRGAYRDVLSAVGSLSTGTALARVDRFALRRDGNAVVATVPVTLYGAPKR